MLEADLQITVIALLIAHGFLVHHSLPVRDRDGRSRTPLQGVPGCPDLVIVKQFIWLVELKRDGEYPTAQQRRWQNAGGDLCAVWRPRDLPWIQEWAAHPYEAVPA